MMKNSLYRKNTRVEMYVNNFENKTVSNKNGTLPPLVSVIIPTYNREKTIGRAIKSVLSQTYINFEIIIVDDNSVDSTVSLIRKYEENDPRIHHLQHDKNKGAQAARNAGIQAAKGEWIAFLDSDDEWLPERLQAGLSLADELGVSVIHSECYVKQENSELTLFGIPKLAGDIYSELLKFPGPMFQGLLVRKVCLQRINYLDETIRSYQEWDTAIRLAKYYEFGFVETPLFIYHKHEGDMISKDMKRDADGWNQIVEKHRKEIIRVSGINALKKHYLILAGKYYSLGEYESVSKYFFNLSTISQDMLKIKYFIQSFLTKYHISPDIIERPIVVQYLKKRLK